MNDPEEFFCKAFVFAISILMVTAAIGGGLALTIRFVGAATHALDEQECKKNVD